MKDFSNKLLLIKNTKRIISIIAVLLLVSMTIANICGVTINDTLIISIVSLISVNSIAGSYEKKYLSENQEYTENDKRTIINGFINKSNIL